MVMTVGSCRDSWRGNRDCLVLRDRASSFNELAAKGNSTACGRRVLNVHARRRASQGIRDSVSQGRDLGRQFPLRRNRAFQHYNEYRQSDDSTNDASRIMLACKYTKPDPRLPRRRLQGAAHRVGERPRKARSNSAV